MVNQISLFHRHYTYFLAFKAPFNHSKSGPDHLRKSSTEMSSQIFD